MNVPIYLDYAAHTKASASVLQRFLEATTLGNASASHAAGRQAKVILDQATDEIAALLHVAREQILYTSGASESNNTAIKGWARIARHTGKHILSTPLEHPSVSGALSFLQEQGYEVDLVPMTRQGVVDLAQLEDMIRPDTVLICVCAVDSELGIPQPLEKIKQLLKKHPHCRLHVDATQAIGKIPFSFEGIHTASLSAHKFFGICGSGLLIKGTDTVLEPLIHGGAGALWRSGTPTVALNAALAEALCDALCGQAAEYQQLSALNSFLRANLSRYQRIVINSPASAIPHILNVSLLGVKGALTQQMLSARGIYLSVKSACASPNTPSRAVLAISGDKKRAGSSFRISMSRDTTQEELEIFLNHFDQYYQEICHV